MNLDLDLLAGDRERCHPLLDRLAVLFEEMDRTYASVAERYGFRCTGCADNCCLTRFYHHTLVEYLYLMKGMHTLETDLQGKINDRARVVREKMASADRKGESLRIMCPLNHDDRCQLYPYRPMICRLHGIPHELQRPGGGVTRMPGCDAFLDQCRSGGKTEYIRFDRTPLYRRMAKLEKEVRMATGYTNRIKLTVAEMLATYDTKRL